MANPLKLFLLGTLLLLLISPAGADELEDHPFLGELAPEFELPTVRGEMLALSDLRDQYVVIHFGTSW